jgi:cytochrome-b5 reductase
VLRNELDFLATMSRGRFQVTYVLHKPTKFWRGQVGFVQPKHIEDATISDPARAGKVLLCGPPPMINAMK